MAGFNPLRNEEPAGQTHPTVTPPPTAAPGTEAATPIEVGAPQAATAQQAVPVKKEAALTSLLTALGGWFSKRKPGAPEKHSEPMEKGIASWNAWMAQRSEADAAAPNKKALPSPNLSGEDYKGRHLRGINLRGVDLRESDFSGADLSNANLQGANLRHANLAGAILEGAKLHNADLCDADLTGACLTTAVGMETAKLGGSVLTMAQLPEGIKRFDSVTQVSEVSKNASALFLSVVVASIYCALAIASTTDMALITNTATYQLPVINTSIPVASFYLAGPLVLAALHVNLNLYLLRLWAGIAQLPARFPDGQRVDERLPSWLMSGIMSTCFKRLRPRPPLYHFQVWTSFLTAWCLVPLTLLLFWARYLPAHEVCWGNGFVPGSVAHAVLIGLVVACGTACVDLTFAFLWRDRPRQALWQRKWFAWLHWRNIPHPLAGIAVAALLAWTSNIAIQRPDWERVRRAELGLMNPRPPLQEPPGLPGTRDLDALFRWLDLQTWPKLTNSDVSSKPSKWTGKRPGQLPDEDELRQVKGAQLAGRDLSWVEARSAFLVQADLTGASLIGADLSLAQLQRANLSGANMAYANLRNANAYGIKGILRPLESAETAPKGLSAIGKRVPSQRQLDLTRAIAIEADFRYSSMYGAILVHSSLNYAKLSAADLMNADLTDADLQGVEAQGTIFMYAKLLRANLSKANLLNAKLGGATLTDANLQNASLEGANLAGARLAGADLRNCKYNKRTVWPDPSFNPKARGAILVPLKPASRKEGKR